MLNLNIFYDQSYWLSGRKIFSDRFSQSSFFNIYYQYKYNRNQEINNNFIKSGPEKLVNQLIRFSSMHETIVLNEHKYDNYYFCNFDRNNENLVKRVLENKNNKLAVGPLYTFKDLVSLSELTNEYNNLKIVTASKLALDSTYQMVEKHITKEKLVILPVGIKRKVEIEDSTKLNRNSNAIIYFKRRSRDELYSVKNLLESRNIKYKIFEYGKYKNSDLINYSKKAKFGVVLDQTESQGIALNELICNNLPLFVLDYEENRYENFILKGSSVPLWSEKCGEKVNNFENIDIQFDRFFENVLNNYYQPYIFASEVLSFEAMYKNFEKIFKNISS